MHPLIEELRGMIHKPGLDDSFLSSIRNLLADGEPKQTPTPEKTAAIANSHHSTDDLYRSVLTYLKLHDTSNLNWQQVFDMTGSMVERAKPGVWPPVETLLLDWRLSSANELLLQARDLIQDDALFEDFSRMYLDDEEEAMNQVLAATEDVDLVERLKSLQISGGSGVGRQRRIAM